MSWWAQSIANTLRLNDSEPDTKPDQHPDNPTPNPTIREDLSELTEALSRNFWGVASFLSPPPDDVAGDDVAGADVAGVSGMRTDLSEIFSNIARTDFSRLASDLLRIGDEDDDDVAGVGVREETVAFAREVAERAETWLDFPLGNGFRDLYYDEFDMSDAQQYHALAIERLAPRLAALRIELCPEYMSESCFWMIYFVLLHPRLSEQDAEILSTPEILKARALLTQEMQNRTMEKSEENQLVRESYFTSDTNITPLEPVPSEPGPSFLDDKFATDKHPILTSEIPIVDKSVIKEQIKNPEDEADDWFREENSDTSGVGTRTIPIENDEDVSFSDLEEDDENASTNYKKVAYGSDSSTKESRDWVQLGRSSTDTKVSAPNSDTKESSDWLDLEEIDVE